MHDAFKRGPTISLRARAREVVLLAYPVVLSMLSHTLMTAVDIALLGHFGTVEQGAAGLANAFLWVFIVTCNCAGVGVNIYVAQYWGAQDYQACGSMTWQGLYMGLAPHAARGCLRRRPGGPQCAES